MEPQQRGDLRDRKCSQRSKTIASGYGDFASRTNVLGVLYGFTSRKATTQDLKKGDGRKKGAERARDSRRKARKEEECGLAVGHAKAALGRAVAYA